MFSLHPGCVQVEVEANVEGEEQEAHQHPGHQVTTAQFQLRFSIV